MIPTIYKGGAIYEIQNAEEGHNIYLYIERIWDTMRTHNVIYHGIAYHPDSNIMLDCCDFRASFLDLSRAAIKALMIMRIPYTTTKRIRRDADIIDTADEPEVKIQILKTLASRFPHETNTSKAIENILQVIRML